MGTSLKITIERKNENDEDIVEVFQDVTDYYVAVRQLHHFEAGDGLAGEYQTRSYSCQGGGLREVVKELRQSLVELDLRMSKET